jgi:hypothetical protein
MNYVFGGAAVDFETELRHVVSISVVGRCA